MLPLTHLLLSLHSFLPPLLSSQSVSDRLFLTPVTSPTLSHILLSVFSCMWMSSPQRNSFPGLILGPGYAWPGRSMPLLPPQRTEKPNTLCKTRAPQQVMPSLLSSFLPVVPSASYGETEAQRGRVSCLGLSWDTLTKATGGWNLAREQCLLCSSQLPRVVLQLLVLSPPGTGDSN